MYIGLFPDLYLLLHIVKQSQDLVEKEDFRQVIIAGVAMVIWHQKILIPTNIIIPLTNQHFISHHYNYFYQRETYHSQCVLWDRYIFTYLFLDFHSFSWCVFLLSSPFTHCYIHCFSMYFITYFLISRVCKETWSCETVTLFVDGSMLTTSLAY